MTGFVIQSKYLFYLLSSDYIQKKIQQFGARAAQVGIRADDQKIAKEIKKARPRFVGLLNAFEWDVEIEKDLLKEDVVIERIANTEKLPNEFMFYGMPLKIKDGDGAPIRAFAVIENY